MDRSDDVLRGFRARQFDTLISVGGDGSLNIARRHSQGRLTAKQHPVLSGASVNSNVFQFNKCEGTPAVSACAVAFAKTIKVVARKHREVLILWTNQQQGART